MKKIAFLILIWSLPLTSPEQQRPELVIWNVGQGLWTTFRIDNLCLHFDMGGESDVTASVQRFCKQRKNFAFLSHWHWAHLSFIARAARVLTQFCIVEPPGGPASQSKQTILQGIKRCSEKSLELVAPITPPQLPRMNANDHSKIFILLKQVLLPGDSSAKMENRWAEKISHPERIKWLVLGHHGSKTSTSIELLKMLSGLSLTIASARKAKYRHPHQEIELRLRNYGIPVLKTEDWGNIHLFPTESSLSLN